MYVRARLPGNARPGVQWVVQVGRGGCRMPPQVGTVTSYDVAGGVESSEVLHLACAQVRRRAGCWRRGACGAHAHGRQTPQRRQPGAKAQGAPTRPSDPCPDPPCRTAPPGGPRRVLPAPGGPGRQPVRQEPRQGGAAAAQGRVGGGCSCGCTSGGHPAHGPAVLGQLGAGGRGGGGGPRRQQQLLPAEDPGARCLGGLHAAGGWRLPSLHQAASQLGSCDSAPGGTGGPEVVLQLAQSGALL
jgi:hypothetical protein